MEIKEKLRSIAMSKADAFHDFQRKVEKNAAKIFSVIKAHLKYSVSRYKIRGSVGMRSRHGNKNQTDFDLVIFINYKKHEFYAVLAQMESVMMTKCQSSMCVKMEAKTNCSQIYQMRDVTVSENRINAFLTFELLLGMNLLSCSEDNNEDISRREKEDIQTDNALQAISNLPPAQRNLSSYQNSLAERYVYFMEMECECNFIRRVVRLGKMWNLMIEFENCLPLAGRSMVIELVAISCARAEKEDARKGKRDASILKAIQNFLHKFLNFDNCMFEIFENEKSPYPWFLRQKYIEEVCSLPGPKILDPINPFNNLALNVTSKMKIAFRIHAKLTLKKIHNYRSNGKSKFYNLEAHFGASD